MFAIKLHYRFIFIFGVDLLKH